MESLDLLVDSCCTGFLLKRGTLFEDLDEWFHDEEGNAQESRTAGKSPGTAQSWVVDGEGKQCELELKQALRVPNCTRNFLSGEQFAQQGRKMASGRDANNDSFCSLCPDVHNEGRQGFGKLKLFLADVGKPQTLVSVGALQFKSR